MKYLKIFILFILSINSNAQNGSGLINVNPDPNGDPWIVGGYKEPSIEELNSIKELIIPCETIKRADLPYRINNSNNPYFPPIVLQEGGSCGQVSGIAYTFTYEINFRRD